MRVRLLKNRMAGTIPLKIGWVIEVGDDDGLAKDGRVLNVSLTSTALIDELGDVYAIATTERVGVDDANP